MAPSRYQYASRTLQAHSKAARAQDDFARRCEALRARLGDIWAATDDEEATVEKVTHCCGRPRRRRG